MLCECAHAFHEGACSRRRCDCAGGRPFRLGPYRHHKGNFYEALGLGKDTETKTVFVEYLDSDGERWHRALRTPRTHIGKPYGWLDPVVEVDGETVALTPRFSYTGTE